MRFAAIDELGAQHAACADRLAISFQRLVHHRKAVALAQAFVEVDGRAKNIGQLIRHAVRQIDLIGRRKERRADDPACHALAHLQRRRFHAGCQAGFRLFHDQPPEFLASRLVQPVRAQGKELLPVIGLHCHGPPRAAEQRVARVHMAAQKTRRLGIHHPHARQQRFRRIAAARAAIAVQRQRAAALRGHVCLHRLRHQPHQFGRLGGRQRGHGKRASAH